MRVIDVIPLPPRSGARGTQTWALVGVLALFSGVGWRIAGARSGAVEATLAPVAPRAELREEEVATIELFKRNSPAVVHITNAARVQYRTRDPEDIPLGTGTGFVWDDQGHIVTNYHVVHAQPGQSPRYYVRFAGEPGEHEAELVGVAPHKDLAVLRLIDQPERRARPITVGASEDLQVGQKVFAIGNPFGLDQTLTTGVISGIGRSIRSLTNHKITGVIQTDAAINPGNSGGPLLDSGGRLIGVNTAIVSPSGAYAGIGFAVPVDTIRQVVPELIVRGVAARPGLGVALLDPRQAAQLGLTGLGILRVTEGSAAARAGLRSMTQDRNGYYVDEIIGVDGVDVRSEENLFDVLDEKSPGETVLLKVRRGSRVTEIPVKLQLID